MSDTTFYYIIGGLAAILAVLLFNSYKEKRYRDEVRRQFGHSDQDALLDSKREEVRDGQGVLNQGMMHHQHSQAVAEQELSPQVQAFTPDETVRTEPAQETLAAESAALDRHRRSRSGVFDGSLS